MLPDRPSHRLPHVRVAKRRLQRGVRDADTAGGDVDASELEAAEHLRDAAALDTAEEACRVDRDVVEQQLHRVDAPVAELPELAGHGVAVEAPSARAAPTCRGCRGDASRSVFTSRARQLPWPPFVIQVFVPLTMYVSPSRRAVVRIACRSVPHVGSVSASPPRSSPDASFGRNSSRCDVRAERADEVRHHQVRVEDAGERHPDGGDLRDDLGVGRRREAEPAVLGRGSWPRRGRTRASARPSRWGTRRRGRARSHSGGRPARATSPGPGRTRRPRAEARR